MELRIDLKDVDELVRLSMGAGEDPSLVQAAGGNTSVKSADGKVLYVKASGTPLGQMSRGRGWLAMDREALNELLAEESLAGKPVSEAKELVAEGLLAARIDCSKDHAGLAELETEAGKVRPSVESLLHAAISGRVVLHTHPPALNGLLCSVGAQRMVGAFREVCGQEPLWVIYTEPGYQLAKRLEELGNDYAQRHGQEARFMFLGNHGLFVSAHSGEAALADTHRVLDFLPQVVELARDQGLAVGQDSGEVPEWAEVEERQLQEFMSKLEVELGKRGMDQTLMWQESEQLVQFSQQGNVAELLCGASTPEGVLYCGRAPVIVDGLAAANPGKLLDDHQKQFGGPVRVIDLLGRGYIAVSGSETGCRRIIEVYESHLGIVLGSLCFGGPKLLSNSQAEYLDSGGAGKYHSSTVCSE
ncbi:MAG: class II aldolase [Phycisphaerae bacterium]|nr:class II aldolase [Phycisphaerae bacterium]